jgi:hypothetical protein
MNNNELMHFGIKGMKWGVRRFQNEDGTRTPKGKARERSENKKNRAERSKKIKRAVGIGMAVVGAGLIAYGMKKHFDVGKDIDKTKKLIDSALDDHKAGMRDIAKKHLDQTEQVRKRTKEISDALSGRSKPSGKSNGSKSSSKKKTTRSRPPRDREFERFSREQLRKQFGGQEGFNRFMESDEPFTL